MLSKKLFRDKLPTNFHRYKKVPRINLSRAGERVDFRQPQREIVKQIYRIAAMDAEMLKQLVKDDEILKRVFREIHRVSTATESEKSNDEPILPKTKLPEKSPDQANKSLKKTAKRPTS